MQLPEEFVTRIEQELGSEEAGALCRALDDRQPVSVRLHPLRGALLSADMRDAEPIPWCDQGWYLAVRPSFTLDPAFHGGAYYVQEASSQFVERLLPTQIEGMRLLDLCAAPGGKTTLYASRVGAEGLVVANEIDRKRVLALADNVRKWGLGNVAVTCADAERFAAIEGWFDLVAVDAPCSGEGMFRKDDGARAEWSEQNVRVCAARQDAILQAAWQALRPGGVLIYSTCTFNREEDEGSLERLIEWVDEPIVEAEEVEVDPSWGILCGRVGAFQTFRFFPHRAKGEGFFAAVARKAETAQRGRLPKSKRKVVAPVDRTTGSELARWVIEPEGLVFVTAGECCYGWPKGQVETLKALSEWVPTLYSGVAMGQLFKGRLKPDQALAHYVGLNRAAVAVSTLDEEASLAYLRRGDLRAEWFSEGLNLVCFRGLPLGFAKRIGGRVNNLYPNALRILKQD